MTFTPEDYMLLKELLSTHRKLKAICNECPIKECARCKIFDEIINIESEIRKLIIKEESWELK